MIEIAAASKSIEKEPLTPSKSPGKLLWTVASIIIIAGIWFRFSNLDRREYYIDEALTSLNVAGYTYKDVSLLQPGYRVIAAGDLNKYQAVNRSAGKCLTALAINGGEHPPAYFLLSWCWERLFGSGIIAMRILPALISLLLLPAVYWLCAELFRSRLTGVIAMAIVSLSPLQLLYAQYAREYSLWIVATAFSGALLLRALRVETWAAWAGYGAVTAIAFYTHPLALAVAAGQSLFTLIMSRFRVSCQCFRQLISAAVAALFYLPWIAVMITYRQSSDEMLQWLTRKVSILSLCEMWLKNLSHVFFQISQLEWALAVVAMILTVSSFISLWKQGKKQFALITILVLSGLLPLLLPDLLFGGVRSQIPRYLIPCILGIGLAVAFLFASLISSRKLTLRVGASLLLASFLSVEFMSCAYISSAAEHQDLPMHGVNPREIALTVNSAESPLIICPVGRKFISYVLTLSHYLNPQVHLLICNSDEVPVIPGGFSAVYLFNPTPDFFKKVQNCPRFLVYELPGLRTLWQIREKSSIASSKGKE